MQPKCSQAKAYLVKQVRAVILKMMLRYEIILYWRMVDQAFIAEVPELPGCAADGETYQEAQQNVEVIMLRVD